MRTSSISVSLQCVHCEGRMAAWSTKTCSLSVLSPLTKVKLINELNEREANLGVNESVSWHTEYKDSAWIFVGEINRHSASV